MPITPSCQPSPAATSTRSPRSSAPLRSISAAAARRIVSSTCWRSRLRPSSCSASGCASAARRREQEVERERRIAQPAGGVDARREPEAEVGCAHARRVDAGARHERAQAGAVGLGEAPQAAPHERAVLVGQRHDVGDRRQRDEVGELVERRRQVGRVAAVTARPERLRELEHDARAAQVGERIGRAGGRARGHDRRVRQHVARAVVVGHDDVEPELAGARDGLGSGDAAVDGDQQPGAGGCQRLDARRPRRRSRARSDWAGTARPRRPAAAAPRRRAPSRRRRRRRSRRARRSAALPRSRSRSARRPRPCRRARTDRAAGRRCRGTRAPRPASVSPRRTSTSAVTRWSPSSAGELAHLVGAARRDRERRGHPANLGLGPDAAPPRREAVSARRARAGCGRAPRAAAAPGPW